MPPGISFGIRNGGTAGLCSKGCGRECRQSQGETALILAATQYEADAVRLLLEKGAQVNAKTNTGEPP